MELHLTPAEVELLRAILADRQGELFREISRAQHYQFKITLRQKETLLDSVVRKLDVLREENSFAFGNDPTLG